jgi:hypothetical protein
MTSVLSALRLEFCRLDLFDRALDGHESGLNLKYTCLRRRGEGCSRKKNDLKAFGGQLGF